MKNNKLSEKKILNKFLLVMISLFITLNMGVLNIFADEGGSGTTKSVIHNLKITDENGNPLSTSVNQWSKFRINADFKIPNNTLKGGDITKIKLPDQLVFADSVSFELKDSLGHVIANASIDEVTKLITLTYTSYIENNSDVEGSFYFYTRIDTEIIKENVKIPVNLDIDGKTQFVGDIEYEITRPTETEFDKSGWFEDGGSNKVIVYALDINKARNDYNDVVIKDQLGTKSGKIVPGSIRIEKGKWIINDSNTGWHLDQLTTVTDQYDIEINNERNGFSINLGDIREDEGFAIRYQFELDYEAVDGETITNKASLNSTNHETVETEREVTYIEGGGHGNGNSYSIALTKTDEHNQSLTGAKFKLIRNRTNTVIGEYTVDSNGKILIEKLLKDTYTLVETVAPEGYSILKDPITILEQDFNNENTAYINVVNKKTVYPIIDPVKVGFNISKKLEGGTLVGGQFEFELKTKDGKLIETVKNDEEGRVLFSELEFNKSGTYEYTIEEIKGNKSDMTYDDHTIFVTVKISENNGTLESNVTYSGDTTFVNTINPEEPIVPITPVDPTTPVEPTSPVEKDPILPNTGIDNEYFALASIIAGVGLLILKWRYRSE